MIAGFLLLAGGLFGLWLADRIANRNYQLGEKAGRADVEMCCDDLQRVLDGLQ